MRQSFFICAAAEQEREASLDSQRGVLSVLAHSPSLIFSTSFKEEKNLSNVFGSNLLGIVFGGALEYTSNIWGLNQLYILGLILYVLSLLPRFGAFSAVALGQFSRDGA